MTKAIVVAMTGGIERLSLELTNRCSKACRFCYNGSAPNGDEMWSATEVVDFIGDCAAHGVKAVSFGGGEPLQFEGLDAILTRLDGVLFRSLTTNGLMLGERRLDELARARPDKIHVSLHFPDDDRECDRVVQNVAAIETRGIRAGVNLLVTGSGVEAAASAARRLREQGIENDRIVFLPMRGHDTPSPAQVQRVAGDMPFQSMTCLVACGRSARFCSVSWDRRVAWCSYTTERRPLPECSFSGLMSALDGLGINYCGGTND